MKKSYKKLLSSLITCEAHRFKYKTYKMNPITGDVDYSNWIQAWTDGAKVCHEKLTIPLAQLKQVTSGTHVKNLVMAHLRETNSDQIYYQYQWEFSGGQNVFLDRNHPWMREMLNDV